MDGLDHFTAHTKPCKTFDKVSPVPDGYEMKMDGTTLFAVDPLGIMPVLYFSFSEIKKGLASDKFLTPAA